KRAGEVVLDDRTSDIAWATVRQNDRVCVFRSWDSSSPAVGNRNFQVGFDGYAVRIGRGVVPGIWVIDSSRRSNSCRIGNGAGRTRIYLPFRRVRDLAARRHQDCVVDIACPALAKAKSTAQLSSRVANVREDRRKGV